MLDRARSELRIAREIPSRPQRHEQLAQELTVPVGWMNDGDVRLREPCVDEVQCFLDG